MEKHSGLLKTRFFTPEDVSSILARRIDDQEHLRCFYQMREFMIDQARKTARESAYSYRGFLVGASVYAHNGFETIAEKAPDRTAERAVKKHRKGRLSRQHPLEINLL